MPLMFGRSYRRQELLRRVGGLSQVGGVTLSTLTEGQSSGVRIADVRSGSGLRFQVTLDRGMDIGEAEYRGIPLAWRSPAGDVHPSHGDAGASSWNRMFHGGLLTGCGLTYLGAPCVDGGEALGQHGRLSFLQASEVSSGTRWNGDECLFEVAGSLRECVFFKENLLLRRTIRVGLGEAVISVQDIVRNEGPARSPLMILYHVNAGWPLVDRGARLMLRTTSTTPRDAAASAGVREAQSFSAPQAGYAEQVFYHALSPGGDGFCTSMLANNELGIALVVRFRQKELPRFIEWKMMGETWYVVGLEPANCLVEGRAKERAAGTLQFLEPGEEREFLVQIGVIEGNEEIAKFAGSRDLA